MQQRVSKKAAVQKKNTQKKEVILQSKTISRSPLGLCSLNKIKGFSANPTLSPLEVRALEHTYLGMREGISP